MTQYYFGPVEEADVQLLTEGIVSDAMKTHAQRLLAPLTRTDEGQTSFVYAETEDRVDALNRKASA